MIRHFCMNIEGAIANAKDLKGCITVDGKTLATVKEIRDFMRKQLAMGRKVLPMCRCSNFDYQKGCLGHEKPEKWLTLKHLGLNIPTEVEYEGKELVTVGLDIEQLVEVWRKTFDLYDCIIWLITDKDTIETLSKSTIPSIKSIKELFAEYEVYFWDEENADK